MSRTARLTFAGGASPVGAAHPVHAGHVAADVARDHPDGVGGHVELVPLRVLEDEVVAFGAGELAVHDARVAAHAVDPVHGEVSRLELVGHPVAAPSREARGLRV